ncbi:MAG: methyltransferase domain-containing protein [Actinomycetia bacterium]|nr:methyltransferase domain-containing protein [Actinomycetes bacterium]
MYPILERRGVMFFHPSTREALEEFLARDLVVDPWLTTLVPAASEAPVPPGWAEAIAARVAAMPLDPAALGRLPISRPYLEAAAREMLRSSVVFHALVQTGRAEASAGALKDVERRFTAFVRAVGAAGLAWAYAASAGTENLLALRYYRRMAETDFVAGTLHRPWIARSLETDLLLGLASGVYRLRGGEAGRVVELTPLGRRALDEALAIWQVTGYDRVRHHFLALAQFNTLADWDEVAESLMPGLQEARRAFVRFAAPRLGQRVLELRAGTGLLTFEAGLADVVRTGTVTALNPSIVMQRRAEAKRQRYGADHVRLVHGLGRRMPFPDGAFDTVVGFSVLEGGDPGPTLAEVRRVLAPGGHFALGWADHAPLLASPLIQRWFSPLLRRRSGDGVDPPTALARLIQAGLRPEETVRTAVTLDVGRVECMVRTLLQYESVRRELFYLPYAARQALIQDLPARGRFLLRRWRGPATLSLPLFWVAGRRD